MRIPCFLFSVLLSALPATLSAQEYTISLEGKQLNIKKFPYYVVQVTDARTQDYCLGIALVGLNHRRAAVFSKDSLTAELSGLFARTLDSDTMGRQPVVVRINHLFVYETMLPTEQAFLEISLSFLQPTPGGQYLELATIGATSTRRSGTDVSRKHDDNIASGIYDCLVTLRERAHRGLLGTQLVNAASLYRPPAASSFAMLQTGPNQAGIFYTFSDFLNNTPQEEPGLSIEMERVPAKSKRAEYYKLKNDDQLPGNRNIWGLSDGTHAYAMVFGDYYRLERAGDAWFVMAPGPASSDDALTGALIGGLLGGAIGGVIGGAIGGSLAEDKAGPPTRFQVDLLTSSLTPVDVPNARRVEARVVLFCSEFAKAPITVRLDGQEICTLEKGTFHRLRLPPPASAITLTLEANGKTYQEKVQPEMFNTELCLLRIVKGEPRLDSPDGDTRRKLLRQITDGEVEERCKQ